MGAPYIYDISRLRVNFSCVQCSKQFITPSTILYYVCAKKSAVCNTTRSSLGDNTAGRFIVFLNFYLKKFVDILCVFRKLEKKEILNSLCTFLRIYDLEYDLTDFL